MQKCAWWACEVLTSNQCCSKECGNKYRVDRRRRACKLMLVRRAGGKCVRCGYSRSIEALDFHHRDPTTKVFGVRNGSTTSFEKLCAEADKCDLVCANCHREVEAEPFLERWNAAEELASRYVEGAMV